MKKLLTLVATVMLTTSIYAQVPQKMSYQAVIRNASDELIANTVVGVRISITQLSAPVGVVFVETHTTTTNANGLASLEIGAGTAVIGTFAGINWAIGQFSITIETDPLGGTAYSISGTSQLTSVPYALFAANGALPNGTSGQTLRNNGTTYVSTSNLFNDGTNVGIGTTTPTSKLDVAGTTKTTNFQMTNGAAPNKVLTSDASGNASWQTATGGGWGMTGNAGTVGGTNFIGTTDNVPLVFKVNNLKAGKIDYTSSNAFYGVNAGNSTTGTITGLNNTAMGNEALVSNISGSGNTATGSGASYFTTGSNNTAVGWSALASNTSGSSNTALGKSANVLTGNLTNATVIGADATVNASNKVQIGNNAVTAVQLGTGTNVTLETGAIKLTRGTLAAGKVLTSDASGNASWQNATGSGLPAGNFAGNTTYWNGTSWVTTSSNLFNNGGNIGIGTTAPLFKLSLDNDGGILAKGLIGFGTDLTSGGAGTRMIWYPKKSAFRVGTVQNTEWDNANIGAYSFAQGFNASAAGEGAVAIGKDVSATSPQSIVMGTNCIASGAGYSIVMGKNVFDGIGGSFSVGDGDLGTTTTLSASTAYSFNTRFSGGYNFYSDRTLTTTNGMFFKAGKLGIGNENPTAKLDVAGTVKIADGTQGLNKVLTSAADGTASWQTATGGLAAGTAAGNMPYWNGTSWVTNNVFIKNTGSSLAMGSFASATGIGAFAVGGEASGAFSIALGNAISTNNHNGAFIMGDNGGTGLASQTDNSFSSRFIGGYRFFSDLTATTANGMFFTGGKLGIGNVAPVAKLDVAGNVRIADGTQQIGRVLTSDQFGYASWQQLPRTHWTATLNDIFCLNTGNVSIGTDVPATKLDVNGQITIRGGAPAANYVLTSTDANGTAVWAPATGGGATYTAGSGIAISGTNVISATGGGSSPWTTAGNDINNSNSGKVLMGDAPFSTGSFTPRFQIRDNTTTSGGGQQATATIEQLSTSYSAALSVKDDAFSGNPKGSPTSGQSGNVGVQAFSRLGDAFYGSTQNGRGLYINGGTASGSQPAAYIENKNGNAFTALELAGKIKITDGTEGLNKVLTSDASGNASWQNASGVGGTAYTAGTGISISGSNVISTTGGAGGWGFSGNSGNSNTNFIGNTDAVDFVVKTNNTEAARFTSGGAMLVTGSTTLGITPVSGPGTRMMWIPNRAAFRAGSVTGTHWNDIQMGTNSAAFGNNCIAAGFNSFAAGNSSSATGNTAIALGNSASAGSANSVAIGHSVNAGWSGAFCFGDQDYSNTLSANAMNQMNMRFSGGYRIFTNTSQTAGVTLAPGAGSWTTISDKNKKENFLTINNEEILQKVSALPITNWNYKAQQKDIRHIGPMAQDFHAAFKLDGQSDTTINTSDIDGINMAAIQALKTRTDELKKATDKIDALSAKLSLLEQRLDAITKKLTEEIPSSPERKK